jgi:hypothetical protein
MKLAKKQVMSESQNHIIKSLERVEIQQVKKNLLFDR